MLHHILFSILFYSILHYKSLSQLFEGSWQNKCIYQLINTNPDVNNISILSVMALAPKTGYSSGSSLISLIKMINKKKKKMYV